MTTKHYEPLQILHTIPVISEDFLLYGAYKLGARFLNRVVTEGEFVAVQMQDYGEIRKIKKQHLSAGLYDMLAKATSMPFPDITLYTANGETVNFSAWTQQTKEGTLEGYLTVEDGNNILGDSPFKLYNTKKVKN